MKKTQTGSEDAMENLAMEYSKLNGEIEEYREQLVLLRQENQSLRENQCQPSVDADMQQSKSVGANVRRIQLLILYELPDMNTKIEELKASLLATEGELSNLREEKQAAEDSLLEQIRKGRCFVFWSSIHLITGVGKCELDAAKTEMKTAAEKTHSANQEKLEHMQNELQQLRRTNESLSEDVSSAKADLAKESETAKSDIARLQSEVAKAIEATTCSQENSQLKDKEIEELKQSVEGLQASLQKRDDMVSKSKQELRDVENRANAKALKLQELLNEASQALTNVHTEAKQERERALEDQRRALITKYEEALDLYQKECEEKVNMAQNKVEDFKGLYAKESSLRKKVHNDLMDLKGNIRVYCRVRPMSESELNQNNTDVIEYPLEKEMLVRKDRTNTSRFEFDSVFGPECTQVQVFQDIEGLIMSALDGYNVCIFAYGQTGSGKTYTMEGTNSDPGVNCRALQKLFEIREKKTGEMEMEFSVSILEIYNETVIDLLASKRTSLDLRLSTEGKVYVENLESIACSSMDEVLSTMSCAGKNRSTGSHNMNEHSSRSHLVVTVTANTKNLVNGVRTSGSLCLIDLAGSERVGKTDATGERLKEAQNINKSLSALGDVIAALGERKKRKAHIPYRNSKLTYLLQNSLGGDSKVAMFVNISPADYNVTESLCSLNFASRCRKVQLGQAKKNSDNVEVAKYRKIIDELQEQLKNMQKPSSGRNSHSQSPSRSK